MPSTDRASFRPAIIAAVWLAVVLPTSFWLRPTWQDFSAFYMGGLIARTGQWPLLYPTPDPQSPYYVGWDGAIRPGHRALAAAHDVQQLCPYLQPPWTALAFWPLSYLPFRAAHGVWIAVLIASTWGVAMCAGRVARLCADRPTRLSGLAVLLVALSPLAYRSIRVGNTSPLVALCIGCAVLSVVRPHAPLAAGTMLVGGIMKYATGALLPLVIAARRWSVLAWLAATGVIVLAATLWIAGIPTWREFLTSVAPTMGGSTTNFGNISLQGMLLRITGAAPLPAGLMWGLRIAQWATLLAVLALLARRPVADWQRGPSAPAAAAALLAWLLIFSPLFWEHYHIYLAPLWGWLVWEAAQTRWRMALVIIALALAWTPLPVIGALRPLPEPVNSGMLFSAMLILGIAIDRLRRPAAPAAPQASASM